MPNTFYIFKTNYGLLDYDNRLKLHLKDLHFSKCSEVRKKKEKWKEKNSAAATKQGKSMIQCSKPRSAATMERNRSYRAVVKEQWLFSRLLRPNVTQIYYAHHVII